MKKRKPIKTGSWDGASASVVFCFKVSQVILKHSEERTICVRRNKRSRQENSGKRDQAILPHLQLAFSLCCFLCCTEVPKCGVVPLVYFCFCCLCLWCPTHPKKKNHCQIQCQEAFPLCFLLGASQFEDFTFKTLIHFALSLVYGIRWGCIFIFLHVDIQFSQHCSLKKKKKRLSFP